MRTSVLLAFLAILGLGCAHQVQIASPTDGEYSAAVATAYCLAVADRDNYATYSVPRDYRGADTCESACRKFSEKYYPNANGVSFQDRGVGDLECTIYRSPTGEVESIVGRPSSYHNSDTAYCDWCCCQLR